MDALAPERRGHAALARQHPVTVALNGIDFAIVRQHAHRLRQGPGREGVGAVTLMEDGDSGSVAGIGKIKIEASELIGGQQSFIDDSTRRKGCDITIEKLCLAPEPLGAAANIVKIALVLLKGYVRRTRQEYLLNCRGRLPRSCAKHGVVNGWGTPGEQGQTGIRDSTLKETAAGPVGFGGVVL